MKKDFFSLRYTSKVMSNFWGHITITNKTSCLYQEFYQSKFLLFHFFNPFFCFFLTHLQMNICDLDPDSVIASGKLSGLP